MIKRKRKIALIIFIVFGGIFLFTNSVTATYIIKGFSSAYILCGVIASGASLIVILIWEKHRSKKIVFNIIETIVVSGTALFSCFAVCRIDKMLCDDMNFHSLTVDGISDERELTLYEYNGFRSMSGCLCFKVNDFVYEIIPDTHYSVETDYSLIYPDSLLLDYNPDTGALTMKYRCRENGEYYENSATLK